MSDVYRRKQHIWDLATTLSENGRRMSGKGLADDLNLNGFKMSYDEEYRGGRGTYTLIHATWHWLNDEKGLPEEARKVAESFVKPDGTYAFEK